MDQFLDADNLLKLVVEFLGFVPSTFYLRACSRCLYHKVTGVTFFSESDFFEALDRKLVNPRYLKLRVSILSDSLIEKLINKTGKAWSFSLEHLLQSKSIDELMILGQESLTRILECSILRVNVALFDLALECIETRGYGFWVITDVLRQQSVQKALMQADALELLKRMVRAVPLHRAVAEDMLVWAAKYRSWKCSNYLKCFTRDWKQIDRIVEAYAFAGDLKQIKLFCLANRNASLGMIQCAIRQAVFMGHLEVAKFLYAEWTRRQMAPPSYRDRKVLIMNLYRGFERNMLRDGPWKNFLDLLFEGIDLTADSRKGRMEWLERAFQGGHRAICRYLIGRGFTSLTLQGAYITLGKVDLLAFVDLCCGSLGDVKDPVVEWFLLKKGVQLRKKHNLVNPVIQVLKEGFQTSCLSNRVELVKELLRIEPKSASQMGFYFPVSFTIYDSIRVTPLGVLELLDTPKIETWTGKNQIGFAMQMEGTKDEWKMQKLNEIEIQAIRDIKAALIAHGADPDTLFAPDALNMLKWRGRYVSEVLIKRLIQGRANVNYQNQVGDTPLRLAIQGDQPVDIVRVLVDFGASIQAQSVGREDEVALRIIWNTLHGGNGHLLGLQAGLKLVKGLQNGLTPLTWILSELADEMLEVTHILLEYGPDIKPPDAGNKTAIFRAISPDDPDSVEWLIKNGADLAVSDYLGAAPLSMARLAVKITGYDDQIHLHNIG